MESTTSYEGTSYAVCDKCEIPCTPVFSSALDMNITNNERIHYEKRIERLKIERKIIANASIQKHNKASRSFLLKSIDDIDKEILILEGII